MKTSKVRGKSWANPGVVLRGTLLLGVFIGVISAKPGKQEHSMSFSDVLNHLEQQSLRGGSGNRDASVDYLRHSGHVPVTCRSRGLCNCYSKAIRRSFCCDCMNGPCFPGDATVTTPTGEVRMSELSTGDTVLAGTEKGEPVWSSVVAWLDRRPHEEAQYLSISTAGGSALTLSSSHLLFTSDGNQLVSRFAGNVYESMSLLKLSHPSSIDQNNQVVESANITNVIPIIMKGAYVPLTGTGTIFVNGILASCYASVTHDLAHAALAPVRWMPSWMTGGQYQGTMPYVTLLKKVATRILPSHYLAPKDPSVVVENLSTNKEIWTSPCLLNLINSIFDVFIPSV